MRHGLGIGGKRDALVSRRSTQQQSLRQADIQVTKRLKLFDGLYALGDYPAAGRAPEVPHADHQRVAGEVGIEAR